MSVSRRRPTYPRLVADGDHRPSNVAARAARTSFVGRADDVREIVRLLVEDRVRVLTLTGPAGVGKTRLALAVADALRIPAESERGQAEPEPEGLVDGVILVELAPLRDPALVVPAIARAVGLRGGAARPDVVLRDELAEHLAQGRRLLVLDNMEHLLDAADDLAVLLEAASDLAILTTSRAPLRLYGEHLYAVAPLPTSPPARDARVADAPAVALFADRARSAQARFRLTDDNLDDVTKLVARLDGLPLAIELAAARVRLLSPRAILERLEQQLGQQLDLLDDGPRDLPPGQRTLRGALDWSYDLFDEDERALFRCLGVFAGGFTLEAAEHVANAIPPPATSPLPPAAPIFDRLSRLVDMCLAHVGADDTADTPARLTMLETVREYALEQLRASGHDEAAHDAHAAYFLALAEEADPKLRGPEQVAWLARLEAEHANLRAALGWLLSDASRHADAPLLAARLAWFWYLHGHFAEGIGWLERALDAGTDADATVRARALNGLGNLSYARGNYARAATAYEQALALMRHADDRAGVANLLNNLGNVARALGDYDRATTLLDECLKLRRELGDTSGTAVVLNNLGLVAQHRGDYPRAAALFDECLRLHREIGDRHQIALALNNLGNIEQHRGERSRAARLLEENLALCRELGDRRGVANALNNLAIVAQERGEYDHAAQLFAESLEICREIGDRDGIANATANAGALALDRGDPHAAEVGIGAGLELYRALGNERGVAWSLNTLAGAAGDRDDPESASARFDDAGARFAQLGDRRGTLANLVGRAELHADAGRFSEAAELYREALGIAPDAGDLVLLISCVEGAARLAVERDKATDAARLLGAAERLRERSETPLPPRRRPRMTRVLDRLAGLLADEPRAAEWAAGRTLSRAEVLELAVAQVRTGLAAAGARIGAGDPVSAEGTIGRPESELRGPGGTLTRREREVVALIARGLSNRQIAAELVITEGTVGTHVEHILRKLDLRSRTQVAAWALGVTT